MDDTTDEAKVARAQLVAKLNEQRLMTREQAMDKALELLGGGDGALMVAVLDADEGHSGEGWYGWREGGEGAVLLEEMTAEDRRALMAKQALDSMGLTSEEVELNAEFTSASDPSDARWQIITIRTPRVHNLKDRKLHGADAQWMAMSFFVSSTIGVLEMLQLSLPLAVTSALHTEAVISGLSMTQITVAAIDERRREQAAKKKEQH